MLALTLQLKSSDIVNQQCPQLIFNTIPKKRTLAIKNFVTELINSLPKPDNEPVQKLRSLLNDQTFLNKNLFTIDDNDTELLQFMCERLNYYTLIRLGEENCKLKTLNEISFLEKNARTIFKEITVSDWLSLIQETYDIVTDHITKKNTIITLYNDSFKTALFEGALCDYFSLSKTVKPTEYELKRTVLHDYKILYDIIKNKIKYVNDYISKKYVNDYISKKSDI